MLRRSTGKSIADRLRRQAQELMVEADGLEKSSARPLFRKLDTPPHEDVGPICSVGWSGQGMHLEMDGEPLTFDQAMSLSASLFWMCFELKRPSIDPGDPKAFADCLTDFMVRVRKLCHQRGENDR